MRFLRAIAVLILLGAAAVGYAFYRVAQPYQGFSGEKFVEFPRGTSTDRMADMLAGAGVVRNRYDFLLARLFQRGRVLKAGEYRFNSPESALTVFERIARGDIFYYTLAVPEGRNMFDIGAAIEQLKLFPAEQFVAAARNPALIHDLDPRAPTLEGYLFPNTYKVGRHATPESICRMMTARFREAWKSLGQTGNPHDAVTLASLVEKEGKLPDERPVIAAVFSNRLRLGMKLDCDPTTIYAALLEHRYRGTIYRSDLESENDYNTYKHAGLPPGPIANPGLASIKAALHPAESQALYFVLRPDGSGGHEFSNTIADQEAAVARYRRGSQR
ncbi:MAG TPA: endolytic transglycosylase MltG [Candidatus Limnocylindrales bacterium]|nr:endolytic transglycosylase MltG [Candidatus Limnocylindrales bacterium]